MKVVENIYREIRKTYRSTMPRGGYPAKDRNEWFANNPTLSRGRQWNRCLWDMNVNSPNSAPYTTGICMFVAEFVKNYIKDTYNIDSRIVTLHENGCFYHAYLGIMENGEEVYYDVFWPEGQKDPEKMMYGDCISEGPVKDILDRKTPDSSAEEMENHLNAVFFIPVKEHLDHAKI